MSTLEEGAKRIAFVVNATAGEELRALNRDVSRVYTILTDPNLGKCESKGPPIFGCRNRNEFFDHFLPVLRNWNVFDQLFFYFSGHGEIRRNQYCLKLGINEDLLPFGSLMNELDANGVNRAILIIDACHSGAAVEGIKNSDDVFSVINKDDIPRGIVVIASSQKSQKSHELKDGSHGVFTKLLCDGLEGGLDESPTENGLISVEDIINYINRKLSNDESYTEFRQQPVFSINKADKSVWITKNKSGTFDSKIQSLRSDYIRSPEELKILYGQTLPSLRPCTAAKIDDLDWEIITKYFSRITSEASYECSKDVLLARLGLYSSIPHNGKNVLHKSAVLCFHKQPENIYPQARAVFVVGDPRSSEFKREDIRGSLSIQVDLLVEKVRRNLERVSSMSGSGARHEIEEIDSDVIRELVSNAITHRDYELNGTIKVTITPEFLEIQSPGRFPLGMSWELFIQSSTSVSCPIDAAIAQYLTHLLVFEGIGRGFDIFKKYVEDNGSDSITCTELPGPTICVRVKRRQLEGSQIGDELVVKRLKNRSLNEVIDAILGTATARLQNRIQRSAAVIKLLKRLSLDPDHPPADFMDIYQYALVEYGVGKPKPVLNLFRRPEIQQTFRQAFEQNNFPLLEQVSHEVIEAHNFGAEIQQLNIDWRRELVAFSAVFIGVARRSRTPAEVLRDQQVRSLHQHLFALQERLDRLPTIEGIRTEMARLAGEEILALPAAEQSNLWAQQCRAYALAQQMRGWFETLGFRFETYEVWQADYFEWIINVPVRRGRYDRILVRGIDGEAGLPDVAALRQSVEQQHTDEGWLVTARRISRAARDVVEQEENENLGCYTLDELLDQDADFAGYLDWLEQEIGRRKIDQTYVPLACTKEEFDPVTKQRIGVSHYDGRDGWIDGYIDLWLDDPAKEHISVLGEFGTGKTWFALHYAWQALQRYKQAKQQGLERPRLPLVIPLRDYAKAVSVESLFSEFFFRKYGIPIPSYSVFEQLNRMGKLLLIFDGFDEMATRIDRQEMSNNFWELAKVVVPRAKVILTCRTEHFLDAKEGRALLNAELLESTKSLTAETPQFEVLELKKFNNDQIRQVLSFQARPTTVKQVMDNPKLLDLACRPAMTEVILEAVPDIEEGRPLDVARIYLYALRRKMERDIKAERTFTSMADKLYFLCELSWEMLSADRMSINYQEFPDRIRRLFGATVQEEKDLDHWHYDMMGQTMLIRNAEGDYTPAHRSLLEFFVAYKFAGELGALAPDFTELAQQHSLLDLSLEPQDYTWSEYFQHTSVVPLRKFVQEPLEVLRHSFGQAPLTKTVTDLLVPMLIPFNTTVEHPLVTAIMKTQDRSGEEAGYIQDNAKSLISLLTSSDLEIL